MIHGPGGRAKTENRASARTAPARAVLVAVLVLMMAGVAGCAAPVPCAVAGDALTIADVGRDPAGFRVTVANRAAQPLTEKVFVEVALVQAGQPVVAGSTSATATWPAGGSVTLAVPYAIDGALAPGAYETFTHFKCLSE